MSGRNESKIRPTAKSYADDRDIPPTTRRFPIAIYLILLSLPAARTFKRRRTRRRVRRWFSYRRRIREFRTRKARQSSLKNIRDRVGNNRKKKKTSKYKSLEVCVRHNNNIISWRPGKGRTRARARSRTPYRGQNTLVRGPPSKVCTGCDCGVRYTPRIQILYTRTYYNNTVVRRLCVQQGYQKFVPRL